MSSRQVWSTKQVSNQPGLEIETLHKKKKNERTINPSLDCTEDQQTRVSMGSSYDIKGAVTVMALR